jgi:hypothetical protein
MKCTKCQGSNIVEGELDAFSAIGLRQTPGVPAGKSIGLWFRETGVETVVNVCRDCGHIELEATKLDRLREKVIELGVQRKK